ncbi:tetratricopeptide repeat protein [Terasakiella sp.]|uniref:tetratricopeptide repeat protein n=1 Tax=Terasakiella sp. TaxID=2034861 RepID=UPI003AA9CF71
MQFGLAGLIIFFIVPIFSTLSFASEKEANAAFDEKKYELALKLHLVEANKGNASSQHMLGLMYSDGLGTPKKTLKAKYWYEKAAEQDHHLSLFNLGVMYLYGEHIPKDPGKALALFNRGYELGSPFCSEALARIYIYGEGGIPKDIEKAKSYLKFSVERGMPISLYLFAQMYLHGVGYPQNEYRAALLFAESANAGLQKAKDEIKRIESNVGMPLEVYLKKTYNHTQPLKNIKICPTPSARRYKCTITWQD